MAESRHHSEVNVDALLLADSHPNRTMDATYAAADDGSVVVKKKRRRRVSFAQTQTVHVIPRLEDLDQIDSATGNIFRKSSSSNGISAAVTFSVASPSDMHEHTADFTCDMDTGHGSWADEVTAVRRMSSEGGEDENGCFVHLGHLSREDEDSIVNDVANDDVTMDATTFTKNLSKFLKFGATIDSQGTGILGKIASNKDSESRSEDDSMNLTRPAPPHWCLRNNPADDNVSVEDGDNQSDMSMATTTLKPRWKQKQNLLHQNISSEVVVAAKDHGPAASDGKSSQPSMNDKVGDFSQQHFVDDADSDSDSSMSVSNTMEMTLPKTRSKNSDMVVDIDVCTPSSPISRHESGTLMQDITFTATDYNGTLPACNLHDLLTDHTSYTVTRADIKVTESSKASSAKRPQSSQKDKKLDSPTSDDMTICSLSTGVKATSEKKRSSKKRKKSVLSMGAAQMNDTELNPMPDSPILQEQTFGSVSKASLSVSKNMKSNSKGENVSYATEGDEGKLSEARRNVSASEMKQDYSGHSNSRSAALDQNDRQGRTALSNISNRDSMPPRSLDFSKGQKKDEKNSVVVADSVVEQSEEFNNGNSNEVKVSSHHLIATTKEDSVCQTKRTSAKKANGTIGKIGSLSIHARQSKGTIDSILQHMEGEYPIVEFQDGEEEMKPSPQRKLQTLSDYLHFSCSVQPQMDWLNEHVQELSEKLKALKQKNAELRSQKHLLQKLKEEPMQMLKTKYEKNQRSARKEWLLWKINPERQNLAWLQENKDNLIKEVDAVHGKAQQVLQLKELYSQILFKEKISRHKEDSVQTAATPSNSSKRFHPFDNNSEKENKEKRTVPESNILEKYQNHYQDASERLNTKQLILKSIQCKVKDIASLYSVNLQLGPEITGEILAEKIKGSVERLIFTNSLLQHQQVMSVDIRSKEGKSQTSFSLDGIYIQNFLYEGDGPQAHVNISRSLNQEAVEMAFPCMEAFIAFEYLISDFPNTNPVLIQNIQQLTQSTKWRVGSLMDLLKEIKFCNRSFRVSSKFQLRNDKLMLNVTSLFASYGLKITLAFDMTCIRIGKYPLDLKPTDVQVRDFGSRSNTHPITRRDVQARIGKLDAGFGRLYKICSCVEKLVRTTKEAA